MAIISLRELLEAGIHFGHQRKRWNPKMAPYIYGERQGIHIINLQKTVEMLEEAYNFVKEKAKEGEIILFVGTKKQSQEAVEEEAKRCGMYYINQRWLGGLLTNFQVIKKRINRLKEIEEMQEKGVFETLPPKEIKSLQKERDRMNKLLGGVKDIPKLPAVIFITDLKKERIAMLEARKLGIDIVAIVDTNCNPDEADYIIPGNDDAVKSIKLVAMKVADAVLEGKTGEVKKIEVTDEKEEMQEMESLKIEELAKEFVEKFEEEEK